MSKAVKILPADVMPMDQREKVLFDPKRITPFIPFKRGAAVFGGFFGDEGKGKEVDILANEYKNQGLRILSVRGQGTGNAGHTVVVEGKKYDFHYLTSAGLMADIMLLGPGMLIDPIRVLKEAEQLPKEKRQTIMVAERAAIVSDSDRAMDDWFEKKRTQSGQIAIGTTKSGSGPCSGNRGYRAHVTFADAKDCKNSNELRELMLKNPLLPNEVTSILNEKYVKALWEAINTVNVVRGEEIIANCREDMKWAPLLEISQGVGLDWLFGNGGHYVTSASCTDTGGIVGSGLTRYDFPDGSTMVCKAYGSKVGGGPFITIFTPEEEKIRDYIHKKVGETGVTTGRKRDLGWFDGPAIRYAIKLTGADICINCMDVIAKLHEVTDVLKVCFAYKNIFTGEVTYGWPYHLQYWSPLYLELPIAGKSEEQIMSDYINLIETVIGQRIVGYGVGPSRGDYRERKYL